MFLIKSYYLFFNLQKIFLRRMPAMKPIREPHYFRRAVKKIFYPFKVLWACWWFFLFAFIFLLFYPVFLFLLSNPSRYHAANWFRRIWAFLLFSFSGLIYRVKHETKLDHSKTYIFCPNHFSYLDIPLFALCYSGNKYRYMAKMELGKIPLFGIFFRTVDISVNRSSVTESVRTMKLGKESIVRGESLVMFPEGKISVHPPRMERFKSGPFRIAIEQQVPVVPITMIDNWKLLFVGKKIYGRPGITRAIVHAPISTVGLTINDVEYLQQKVHSIIEKTLKQYGN